MVSERKTAAFPSSEAAVVQVPEAKVVAVEVENGTMNGLLVGGSVLGGTQQEISRRGRGSGLAVEVIRRRRKADVAQHVVLRLMCMATSVTALSFMVTAKESSTVSIYGFSLPVFSKWSFSHSFEYLVAVSAAVAAHSLLQLLISVARLLRKSPVIPSRGHAWLNFAGDQAFAYAMMSAGSAASGVTNLNHTGIRHTALPNFCKPLHSFCNHVGISIAFTFFSCILLAISAVQDVIWLSTN